MTAPWAHAALVVFGYSVVFGWLFSRTLFGTEYLAQSDLYEYFLPLSLAPLSLWTRFEFAGIPTIADAGDNSFYPVHLLFARALQLWDVVPVSAFVLGASFTYAYVFQVTRSKPAAAVSGLGYALSEGMLGRVPHLGTLHALAWFPFAVLAIDRVREVPGVRWIGLGALGFGCFFLAGHPQPVVYGMYVLAAYTTIGALRSAAGTTAFARASAMVALGLALAAIKAVPVAEGTAHLARQSVSVGQFTSHAPTWQQLAATLLPVVPHDILETPLYCGIAVIGLGLAGFSRSAIGWRVWFWVAVCGGAMAIALGDATPIGPLSYHLPLYDKFRIAARHLFLVAFGAAVLAGFGVAAVLEGRVPARAVIVRTATLLGTLLVVAWALARAPGSTVTLGAVAPQAAFVAAATAAVLCARRYRRIGATALCVIVAADLLFASYYPIGVWGADAPRISSEAALTPSVHARRLANAAAAAGQRLLALDGAHVDPVAPGAFSRVWRIPIAGGYGPMLLDRYRHLASIAPNGAAESQVLGGDNSSLDLLAVRYVLLQPARHPIPRVQRWSAQPLEWTIGRPDCGFKHPRRSQLVLPSTVPVAALELVAYMRCGEDVAQGTQVATLRLVDASGSAAPTKQLLAGTDIADVSLADPAVRARAKHQAVDRARGVAGYVIRWPLNTVLTAARLEVEAAGFGGWLTIDRVTVIDPQGNALPLEAPWAFLADGGRWRQIESIRTSRTSDRGADADVPGEVEVAIYENTRARPRAWVVREIVPATTADMLAAAHTGYLPDGRRFEPAELAMVDDGPQRRFDGGPANVAVADPADGRVVIQVSSDAGGFLVLSESFYPGWRATIDGITARVYRTNAALLGVVVPPGRHTVEFVFAPASTIIGSVISVLALAAAAMLSRRI